VLDTRTWPALAAAATRAEILTSLALGPKLRIPDVAAHTGTVSVARIRLDSRKSVRAFKGIFCDDISEIAVDTVIAVNAFF
jgi:precorrin-6B methylase 2